MPKDRIVLPDQQLKRCMNGNSVLFYLSLIRRAQNKKIKILEQKVINLRIV